jgi:hypothetical protein
MASSFTPQDGEFQLPDDDDEPQSDAPRASTQSSPVIPNFRGKMPESKGPLKVTLIFPPSLPPSSTPFKVIRISLLCLACTALILPSRSYTWLASAILSALDCVHCRCPSIYLLQLVAKSNSLHLQTGVAHAFGLITSQI